MGRLIQTRAPDLRTEDIPPAFRPFPVLAVSDTKRIAEAIAALGIIAGPKMLGPKRPPRLEGIGSASGSPYGVDPHAIGSPAASRPRHRPEGVGAAAGRSDGANQINNSFRHELRNN